MTDSDAVAFRPEDICNFGRTPMGYKDNPLNLTAKQVVENNLSSFKDSAIYQYHIGRTRPTLADVYGVCDPVLETYSFSFKFEPWIHERPKECASDPNEIFSHDYVGMRDLNFYAMYSIENITNLIESIENNGYDPKKFDSHISIDLLGNDLIGPHARSRIHIADGHHRVAALVALDLPLVGVIRDSFCGVDNWSSVEQRFLTKEQADNILNKYMGV